MAPKLAYTRKRTLFFGEFNLCFEIHLPGGRNVSVGILVSPQLPLVLSLSVRSGLWAMSYLGGDSPVLGVFRSLEG